MRYEVVWCGHVLARSGDTTVVSGARYFPVESLAGGCFYPSPTRTVCPWKGVASYLTFELEGSTVPDVAWYYPRPSFLARRVEGRVAFGREVEIVPVRS